MPRYAHEYCDGKRPVRGKVLLATTLYWRAGMVRASKEIPQHKWPFQTNNMDSWFSEALLSLRNHDLAKSWVRYKKSNGEDSIPYRVNDGLGYLRGRQGSHNVFTAEFLDVDTSELVRLDVMIKTVHFAQLYQQKVRKGEHIPIPKNKPDSHLLVGRKDPYIRKSDGVLIDPRGLMVFDYVTEAEQEEFFKLFPEWVNKVEVLDV